MNKRAKELYFKTIKLLKEIYTKTSKMLKEVYFKAIKKLEKKLYQDNQKVKGNLDQGSQGEVITKTNIKPRIIDKRKEVYDLIFYFLEKNNYKLTNPCIKWFNNNISKINNDKIIAGVSIREFSSSLIIYYQDKKLAGVGFETLYFEEINKPIKFQDNEK